MKEDSERRKNEQWAFFGSFFTCTELLNFRKSVIPMKNNTLRMGPRGTVTLPKVLRQQYALTTHDLLLAESTPEGILLRPAVATPIEIYSDERIAEFQSEERKLEERQRLRDVSKPSRKSSKT